MLLRPTGRHIRPVGILEIEVLMTGHMIEDRRDRIASWTFAWWALVGGLLGFGIAGIATIGPALLALAAALALLGLSVAGLRNRSALGLVGGLAAAPLYLAWLNRGGPGRVCSTVGTEVTCAQKWTPWPFLLAAVVLIGVCVVLIRRAG